MQSAFETILCVKSDKLQRHLVWWHFCSSRATRATLLHTWEKCCVVALGQSSANWELGWTETAGYKRNREECFQVHVPTLQTPAAPLIFVLCYVPCYWDFFLLTLVSEPLDEPPVSRLWKGRGDMVPLGSHISGNYIDCILKFTSPVPLCI